MPPAKARAAQEDSRSEDSTTNLKLKAAAQSAAARGKRNGGFGHINGSNLKESYSAADGAATTNGAGDQSAQNGSSGIPWATEDLAILENYRHAYRLLTPSAFKRPLSHVQLSTGIGKYSPTMVAKKATRRISKDQLALAIRKNFNALAVSENEVIVDMLYKVKTQDKTFKLQFGPSKAR